MLNPHAIKPTRTKQNQHNVQCTYKQQMIGVVGENISKRKDDAENRRSNVSNAQNTGIIRRRARVISAKQIGSKS